MIQSHIILTHTFLDISTLMKLLTSNFLEDKKNFDLQFLDKIDRSALDKIWDKYQANGQIKLPELASKKDFVDNLLSFYENYSQPSLLFLGNLQDLSIQAQEGMLKLLEEPPHNLYIILFSHNRNNILPTIISRCQTHILPSNLAMTLLDQDLLQLVQNKLPKAADFAKDLISNKINTLPDTKNLEREEIDFWLWQISIYLEKFYQQQPHPIYLKILAKVLQAKKLNQQNLQKKFALGWLT